MNISIFDLRGDSRPGADLSGVDHVRRERNDLVDDFRGREDDGLCADHGSSAGLLSFDLKNKISSQNQRKAS
jgi:hypothetical protein